MFSNSFAIFEMPVYSSLIVSLNRQYELQVNEELFSLSTVEVTDPP
jgi:hypothetical protein